VGEKINEPRYPSFKGIMAAKKKKVTTLSLGDAGVDARRSARRGAVDGRRGDAETAQERGREGRRRRRGGTKVAAFLVAQKLI
jgi:electron transfer flavoprotein beta subunit